MNKDFEVYSAGDLTNDSLLSLYLEVWFKRELLFKLGKFKDKGWRLIIQDSVEIRWSDFVEIVRHFESFIPEEEDAIRREQDN